MRRTPMLAATLTLVGAVAAINAANAQEIEGAGRLERADRARAMEEIQRAREQRETRENSRASKRSDAVSQFRKTGRPAMLGITIGDAEDGVAVVGVSRKGPADESGVKTGDLIVAMNGVALTAKGHSPTEALVGEMQKIDPGQTVAVTLTVRRDGSQRDIEVEAHALRTRHLDVI